MLVVSQNVKILGELPEWSKGLVSKTSNPQGFTGSNPVLSVLKFDTIYYCDKVEH